MAEINSLGSRSKSAPRAGRMAVFAGVMVLLLLMAQFTPASALPPDYPVVPNVAYQYSFVLPGLPMLDGTPPQPPVPHQGGTCIQGYLIDSYHQPLGAGWPLAVSKLDDDSVNFQTTTNDEGKFELKNLSGGAYEIQLLVENGWRPLLPADNVLQVTISGQGDECARVRFKLEAPSCIQVVKYDAGGQLGDESVGLADWGFTATSNGAKFTAKTDWQGLAYFFDLKPGTWTVTEDSNYGWRPAEGYTNAVQVDLEPPREPGACQRLVFVNEQVSDACITVIKNDNVQNPVEGWEMTITRDDGTQPPKEGETGKDGSVTFYDLALGDWTVKEAIESWWAPVSPVSQKVSLEQPGVCQVVKFVNEPLGCIDGYKINSLEDGLIGWNIFATNTKTNEKIYTSTNDDGYFQFLGLRLGEWVIKEELQPGWSAVTPSELTVQVTKPFTCESIRFKNQTQYACLDVFKQDQIDWVGLPGWQISLAPAYGGETVTGVTDGSGWVRFNELVPGEYKVSEQILPGWVAAGDTEKIVDLKASGRCGVVKFVNRQENMPPPPPHDHKPPKDHTKYTCSYYYTVRPGDTLWGISMWSGVPVNAIVQANHIKNPRLIYSGTRLCIPDV